MSVPARRGRTQEARHGAAWRGSQPRLPHRRLVMLWHMPGRAAALLTVPVRTVQATAVQHSQRRASQLQQGVVAEVLGTGQSLGCCSGGAGRGLRAGGKALAFPAGAWQVVWLVVQAWPLFPALATSPNLAGCRHTASLQEIMRPSVAPWAAAQGAGGAAGPMQVWVVLSVLRALQPLTNQPCWDPFFQIINSFGGSEVEFGG